MKTLTPRFWFPFPVSLDLFFASIETVAAREPVTRKLKAPMILTGERSIRVDLGCCFDPFLIPIFLVAKAFQRSFLQSRRLRVCCRPRRLRLNSQKQQPTTTPEIHHIQILFNHSSFQQKIELQTPVVQDTQFAQNPADGAGSGINRVAKDKAGLRD